MKKLKLYIPILPILIALSVFIILIFLGFWQLSRLKEKNSFLESMHNNLVNSAIDLNVNDNLMYKKVKVNGYFLPNKDIHLYGRKSMSVEKDGYYLVTPFQTNTGQVIMVARGWFSSRNKNYIFISQQQNHEITGVMLPLEKSRLFVPSNDIKNNIWLTLDLGEMSKFLELNLSDFYMILETPNYSDNKLLKPLSINHLANIRNNHLEYALTWFGLAFSLLVIVIYYRK